MKNTETNYTQEETDLFNSLLEAAGKVGLKVDAEVNGNGYDMVIKSFRLSDEDNINNKQLIAECVIKGNEAAGTTAFYANQLVSTSFMREKTREVIKQWVTGTINEAKKVGLGNKEIEMMLLQQVGNLGFMLNGKVRTKDNTKRKITGFRFDSTNNILYVSSAITGNETLGSLEHDICELMPVKSMIRQYVQPIRIDMQCDECENGFMRPKRQTETGSILHECNNKDCRRTETYNQKFPYITYEVMER